MEKKTLCDLELNGKKALVRVDYNVPMDAEGNITDDTRITASLDTLRYLCLLYTSPSPRDRG